jgi:hypothetical protein
MKKLFTLAIALLTVTLVNAQTITNGNMESWHTLLSSGVSLQAPNSWYTLDSPVIALAKTYLKPSGNYLKQVYNIGPAHAGLAAKLVTRVQDTVGMTAGCISNCQDSIDVIAITVNNAHPLDAVLFKGGTDISAAAHRPATVGAWIEYFPNGNDTAHMIINVLNASGAVIGTVDSAITGTVSSYIHVTPHISYTTTTGYKTLQVIFTSSKLGFDRGQDSSVLYVDDVDYTLATGINGVNVQETAVRFYPNPSTGVVYLYNNLDQKLSWQVFNANGQVILNKELADANREDLSYLPSGTYFFNVTNSKGEVVQKDKFTLVK